MIYNVNLLPVLRWNTEEWNMCPLTVILNYFIHCHNALVEMAEEERKVNNNEVSTAWNGTQMSMVFSLLE